MAMYRLEIPTYDTPFARVGRTLWRFFGLETGRTMIKQSGTWRLVTSPTAEVLNAAEAYYRGGYQNTVDQDTADDMTADGFGAYLFEIPGS